MEAREQRKTRTTKAAILVVAGVFTISVSGYFMGLRQTMSETSTPAPITSQSETAHETAPHTVATAVSYTELAQHPLGPNAGFHSRLSQLKTSGAQSGIMDTSDSELLRAHRIARRAYEGAPPTVPHPIDQHTAAACLQCHTKATRIGNVVAPALSHPAYTSCIQCHVSSKGLGSRWNTAAFDLHTGNRFDGDFSETKGHRAYPDSPPTIPHKIAMRQNCMSCHGPLGTSPIRTTHPDRQSCTQCHVPGAHVDKSNFAESPFPFIEEMLKPETLKNQM